jgi:hypothetical protein
VSEENWRIQASYKFGEHQQNLLNVRGENAVELEAHALSLTQGTTVQSLGELGALLQAAQTVASVPTPPQAQGGQGYVPQMPTPVPVQHQPGYQPSATPQAPPPCPHGPWQWKTGVGAKGPWKAWMCPAPKGTPGQCEPKWIR